MNYAATALQVLQANGVELPQQLKTSPGRSLRHGC